MKLPVNEILECKQCGACCRSLIIEVSELDCVRESKIREVAELMDGNGKIKFESEWDKEYLLACGATKPCPFLVDNKCSIYSTRPNVCVAMQAGDEQCRMARGVSVQEQRIGQGALFNE